ncbi:glutamate--cysteine ligase [Roseomonas marmotae]|uniref:Glutamate--cysteine ligase n=1 Tax=Roseomonas marmotae TaxID=2768161 RepID=A0ABS3KC80_9PROT|nr:glutamate--cysteine ligase [Roseomonas marmotae]MBO1075088.1 glutamate--cysteine ligase [Roseomonas marmotae]QTI79795.1 glutamate--cysteine ligase [Roseomonas marmotae]
MSNPGEADLTPITSVRQPAEWFSKGSKPPSEWRIGTEHEKFGFYHGDLSPPPYAPGPERKGGIRALLEGLQAKGWAPILDNGNPIGLTRGQASISLEPGGQFELSGAPLPDLHAGWAELQNHLEETREVAGPLGMGFAPLGFHPLATRDEMPWMPKGRYAIMRQYMPRVGAMGLDMMLRTCTVQVNLDFGDEADMVEKLRVSLALQPLATALFANSPFAEGKPNGFRTLRGRVWTETDPDRTGIPAVAFEQGFGFERFAEHVLDVPMYFIMREGRWIDCAGASFRQFIARGLPDRPDIQATMGDWADHVTTVFTDVRLKRFLEMRGADAGSPEMLHALPAFWTGLLYDAAAQKAAAALVRDWPVVDLQALRLAVPAGGLTTPFRGRGLREVAADALAISRDGLRARGLGEEVYLAPLEEIVATGETQADRWLRRCAEEWGGDVSRIFPEAAAA